MSVTYDSISFDRFDHASVRIETADGTVVYVDPWSDVIEEDQRIAILVLAAGKVDDAPGPLITTMARGRGQLATKICRSNASSLRHQTGNLTS